MMNFLQSLNPLGRNSSPEMHTASSNKQWTTAQNGLDSLKFSEADVPKPGDGEVLVQIRAVSLNFRDTEGEYISNLESVLF